MHNVKSFLAQLSHHPGVYQMLDNQGKVIYVGKAKDLKKRVSSYFRTHTADVKTSSLVKQIANIEVTITQTENEAVLLECNLIKKHMPRYNVLLRDDKSYPYILITQKHTYPRIDIYRGLRKKNELCFGPYPSSFAVRDTINLLQKIFRIRTCRDSDFVARSRPCLLYQIGRCTAPCVGLISKEEYAYSIQLAKLFLEGKSDDVINVLQAKMEQAAKKLEFELAREYRDQITRLRQIQDRQYINVNQGNADIIGLARSAGIDCIQLLSIRQGQISGSRAYFPSVPQHVSKDEVIDAFLIQHYLSQSSHQMKIPQQIICGVETRDRSLLENVLSEQAEHKVEIIKPSRGEKMKWLRMAENSAKQSLAVQFLNKANMVERMRALVHTFNLKKTPERIECFDISHSTGEATVASCVVFGKEGPLKSDYRRFNITDITPGDDVAAMHQVLSRRFKRLQRTDASLPDLVLIDGGKIQLAAAAKVIKELGINDLLLIGVSKGPLRKAGLETLHRLGFPPLHLKADSLALHLIQQIRDEAHRFAITGHRQARDKIRRQSSLELIPGIGAKRRRDLLRYFGGIQGVAHASLDELVKVPGINRSLAERIFSALHDVTV